MGSSMNKKQLFTDSEKVLMLHERYPSLMLALQAFDVCVDSMPLSDSDKERLKNVNSACMNEYANAMDSIIRRIEERVKKGT